MSEYSFSARLAVLVGCDIMLALVDSVVPTELHLIRAMIAFVELAFMVVTMAITIRRVLEDY